MERRTDVEACDGDYHVGIHLEEILLMEYDEMNNGDNKNGEKVWLWERVRCEGCSSGHPSHRKMILKLHKMVHK